ncbi:MAG: hypothetical protein KBS78_01120 [Bacteroidales bacterium]|nr:hypothetical protein [Candidatus Cryptobacteroides faecihippi]
MKRNSRSFSIAIAVLALFMLAGACSTQKKLARIERGQTTFDLSLAKDGYVPTLKNEAVTRDTLKIVEDDGKEILIMKAIKDDDGDMVATDVIDAAVVTARFRNIAERNGKVDLAFQVRVPAAMQDSKWQLRFYPDMFVLGDSIRLDPVIITGTAYRKAQLKGYQQYEKFLSKIVSDSTKFINIKQLELFLKRNIPQVYAFKTDSTYVADEVFMSYYGVSEQQAIDHYTNKFAKNLNDRRKANRDKKYRKYVKAPIVTEGIRLDTVMVSPAGEFIYNYIQTINTRPKLRKVDIVLSGDIYEQDKVLYRIPRSEPLTFYISSVSSFTDNRERYLTKVIERRVEANTACYVEFGTGRTDVNENLGNNRQEISRIKRNLGDLMLNKTFELDSIIVTASASPEGNVKMNHRLSEQRSESISRYFRGFMKEFQDSLDREQGFNVDEQGRISRRKRTSIQFKSRSNGENWKMLDALVEADTILTSDEKSEYSRACGIKDLDLREAQLQKQPSYKYLRESLYPHLRTVKFNFYLHRAGMVKDTVHTTVIDSLYMTGVQLLRDMDYLAALSYLQPYKDFNTAVAYTGLGRDRSALEILEPMKRTAQVNYLLAILYSRLGDAQKAVECYMRSCKQDHGYVYRGNLDPEISALIKMYGLNQEPDDLEDDLN